MTLTSIVVAGAVLLLLLGLLRSRGESSSIDPDTATVKDMP